VNTNEQHAHLQQALANLATAIAKTINQSVEQAVLEALPVRLPTGKSDGHYHRLLNKTQVAELSRNSPDSRLELEAPLLLQDPREFEYRPEYRFARRVPR
jgi:hypothetical protein